MPLRDASQTAGNRLGVAEMKGRAVWAKFGPLSQRTARRPESASQSQTPCATEPKMLNSQKKMLEKMLRISDMGSSLLRCCVYLQRVCKGSANNLPACSTLSANSNHRSSWVTSNTPLTNDDGPLRTTREFAILAWVTKPIK